MSKGGGTNSTIDPRVFDLLSANYKNAQGIANKPFVPYTDSLVATPGAATQMGQNTILGGAMDAGKGALDTAVGSASGLLNFTPPPLTAPTAALPQLSPAHGFSNPTITRGDIANINPQTGLGGIDAYMNPYISSVIDTSLKDLNRAREVGINQNASDATLSHAFGGDRQGVTDAETNRAYLDAAARTAANLRAQGFDTASGLLQNDQAKNLQGQLANQGVDLSVANTNTGYNQAAQMFNTAEANKMEQLGAGIVSDTNKYNAGLEQQSNMANLEALLKSAGIDLSATGLLGSLGGEQQNQFTTGAGQVLGVGAQQDAQQQALLNAAYQQFLRQQGYPIDMQQVLNSALGLFGNANGSATYTQPQSILSNLAGPALSAFAFSDARLKADVETAGHDGRGRRWVIFRYLWDAIGVRRLGVIAQEILQTDPDAVARDESGFLMVDYSKLQGAF